MAKAVPLWWWLPILKFMSFVLEFNDNTCPNFQVDIFIAPTNFRDTFLFLLIAVIYEFYFGCIGLQIRAKASSDDRVVVKFKSSKSSQYPGFSCRVSSQPSPVNQVLGGEVIDIGTADTPDENEDEDNSTSSGNSGKF